MPSTPAVDTLKPHLDDVQDAWETWQALSLAQEVAPAPAKAEFVEPIRAAEQAYNLAFGRLFNGVAADALAFGS